MLHAIFIGTLLTLRHILRSADFAQGDPLPINGRIWPNMAMQSSIPSQYLLILVSLAADRDHSIEALCEGTTLTLDSLQHLGARVDEVDADRVVAISASGRILVPDQLLMLLASDILEQEQGLVLMDAKCSSLVRSEIESKGGVIQIGRTGHSPMKRLMQASGALCGGELSAHYYFADWYGFDDGLYTAVRLLELLQRKGQTLDQLIDSLPQRLSTPEMRIEVADDRKFEIVGQLESTEFGARELISIDGLRVEFADGWGLVRASNTEPALVVRFEADSRERINEIITIFNRNLAQIGANECAIELFN